MDLYEKEMDEFQLHIGRESSEVMKLNIKMERKNIKNQEKRGYKLCTCCGSVGDAL